ncbi:MAG: tRNA-guanine transglycosylase, partial [Verrucomicrobiales bacterium]|nr:tRNA-guanine transglycosylase [Verrucomicrobiales bacterium]
NGFSRAYIRHLIKSEEILGIRLTTLHNLYYYINLMKRARNSIESGEFGKLRIELQENCQKK